MLVANKHDLRRSLKNVSSTGIFVVLMVLIFSRLPTTVGQSLTANPGFTIPYGAQDLGGGRMKASSLTLDVALGLVGGISRASDLTLLHGYAGQLNDPPALTNPGPKTIAEETELGFMVTATAMDADPNDLTFSVSGLPARAVFDSRTERFRWTPGEAQGPGVYRVTFRVADDAISGLIDEEEITITVNEVNEPPEVTIQSLKDDVGREIGGNTKVFIGQRIFLTGSFKDSDQPDSHTTTLDWGDGPSSVVGPFAPGQSIKGDHVYTTKNTYSVTLTVRDAGNLADTARRTVTVVKPAEGLLDATAVLSGLLKKPSLRSKATRFVQKAIDDLIGHNDGRADDGAIDKIERDRFDSALTLIGRAIEHLEEAEEENDDGDTGAVLRDVEFNLALAAAALVGGELENSVETATRAGDQQKIAAATSLLDEAMSRIQRNDFDKAIDKLQSVLDLLKSIPSRAGQGLGRGGAKLEISRSDFTDETTPIRLSISAAVGDTVEIEQSRDLSRWEHLKTITIPSRGTAEVHPPPATHSGPAFYRLKPPGLEKR